MLLRSVPRATTVLPVQLTPRVWVWHCRVLQEATVLWEALHLAIVKQGRTKTSAERTHASNVPLGLSVSRRQPLQHHVLREVIVLRALVQELTICVLSPLTELHRILSRRLNARHALLVCIAWLSALPRRRVSVTQATIALAAVTFHLLAMLQRVTISALLEAIVLRLADLLLNVHQVATRHQRVFKQRRTVLSAQRATTVL